MDPELKKLLISGFLGGIVATVLKVLADIYMARYKDKDEAFKKVVRYAKPLWLSCNDLNYRLARILERVKNGQYNQTDGNSLKLRLNGDLPLEWYTKEGYYITSTAYLIALVASWITLFERDVVFLEFGEKSATAEFFRRIESFKQSISDEGSPVWYHYLEGVGNKLVLEGADRPMTIADFSTKLQSEENFRSYYDQIFQFLNQIGGGGQKNPLEKTIASLRSIMSTLEAQNIVPKLICEDNTAN